MLLIIGFLFMVLTFTVVAVLTGTYTAFIYFPSVLLTLVSLLFYLLATKSGKILCRYINTSFKKEHSYTGTELAALSGAIKNTIKFTLAAGVFGFLVGLIAVLTFIGTPEKLGPVAALSLLTLTYSIAISCFVFFPVQAWAENKIRN